MVYHSVQYNSSKTHSRLIHIQDMSDYIGIDMTERGVALEPVIGAPYTPPSYSSNTALPPQGTAQWKFRWYDCGVFCYPSDFCLSAYCCTWLTLSHLSKKTGAFKRFMGARGIVALSLIVIYILSDIRWQFEKVKDITLEEEDIDGDGVVDVIQGIIKPDTTFPYWLFAILTLIVWKLRYTVRAQAGIAGSDLNDCCLSFFCAPCVTIQMAYQLWKDPSVYPGGLLTEIHHVEPAYDDDLTEGAMLVSGTSVSNQQVNMQTQLLVSRA